MQAAVRQNVALSIVVTILAREMGQDRAALATEAVEAMRAACGDDPAIEAAIGHLFGQGEAPDEPARPALRVIDGGKL